MPSTLGRARMDSLQETIAQLEADKAPYVQVTVVRRIRPSSANVGDRAVVTAAGEMVGFVGGQCTRSLVVGQAQKCLQTGESRLLLVTAHPPADAGEGVTVMPMTCASEGTVELFMEPKLSRPLLLVVGASPIAQALCELAPRFGFDAVQTALETGQGVASAKQAEGDSGGATVAGNVGQRTSADPVTRLRTPWVSHGSRARYGVVATMGLYDVDGVLALMDRPLRYLGVVTSPRRWMVLREELQNAGVPAGLCDLASAPAGIDIGASGPDEIALSILAQVVKQRRRGAAMWSPQPEAAHDDLQALESSNEEQPAATGRVIDPVCGMAVDLATAKHVSVYEGTTYGFCCAGCKSKFEANSGADVTTNHAAH